MNRSASNRYEERPMWNLSQHRRNSRLSRAQLESLVLQRTAALQNLSQRLLKAQDEERRRVARDLHDSTGQTRTALKMGLAALEQKLKQTQFSSDMMSQITALADQALQEIRTT
jgi:signal transduction histidine kinase